MEKERQKASEAEARLRSQSRQNEERVSGLEAKLSELSQVVGNYERTKFQDQQAIRYVLSSICKGWFDSSDVMVLHPWLDFSVWKY